MQILYSDPWFWKARADSPIENSGWLQNCAHSIPHARKWTKKSGIHVYGVQGGKRERGSSSSLIFCASHPHIPSRRQNLQVSTQQIYILIPHPNLNPRSKQLKISRAFVVQSKLPHSESSKICTSLWSLSGISQWEKNLCMARHMHVT